MPLLKVFSALYRSTARPIPLFISLFTVSMVVNSAEHSEIVPINDDSPCRVTMERIKWKASDYHSRLCLRINNERSCFPKDRLAFTNQGGAYDDSSFWLSCAEDYRYGFEWELFSETGNGLMEHGRGAGSQVFHTTNGVANRHSRPYFPQIHFTITPYKAQP